MSIQGNVNQIISLAGLIAASAKSNAVKISDKKFKDQTPSAAPDQTPSAAPDQTKKDKTPRKKSKAQEAREAAFFALQEAQAERRAYRDALTSRLDTMI